MPVAPLSFPKWEEVLSGLIEQYRHTIDLPESLFEDAYELIRETSASRTHYLETESSFGEASPRIPGALIRDVQSAKQLAPNQFLTISTFDKSLLWVDPRVYEVLDIPFGSFTTENLCHWYQSPIVFHPMDILHLLRYSDLIRRFSTVDGMLNNLVQYYFSTQFRIAIARGEATERVRSYRHIHRSSSLVDSESNASEGRILLEVWTVSNDAERHKEVLAGIEVINDVERTKFLNAILFIFNAKALGFNTKDVLVINVNNLYDGPEEGRASLNRSLRQHHDEQYEFEVKPYTDCSYYVNKKLTTALEKHSIERIYKSSFFVRLNRFSKSRRLGLIPLPREVREIILAKAYMRKL